MASQRGPREVIHPARVVPTSDPDHLASIAILFGMAPQRVDCCRVLELGSAGGWNLLPLAERFPESRFVGVDGSRLQVETARRAAAIVELDNVEFFELHPSAIDDEFGTFDYIICHDVYSRVAREVQETILQVCAARLNPHGVLYLSHRVMPGWAVPGIIRDLVRGRTADGDPLAERIAEGRRVLRFVSEALADTARPFQTMLREEAELALRLPDDSLVHEHLCIESHPVYFHQFAERVARHGLQYLGDADIATMFTGALGAGVEQGLMHLAHDMISVEQHLDLVRNRAFRRNLLCKRELQLTRDWPPANVRGLYLAGNLRAQPSAGAAEASDVASFAAASGAVISTDVPAVKAALTHLGELWPRSVSFEALCTAVAVRLSEGGGESRPTLSDVECDQLARHMIDCIANGFVEPHSEADRFVVEVSQHPQASRWARTEAASLATATNRRHQPAAVDEMSVNLLRFLDGQRDRSALLEVLIQAASSGQLSILKGGVPEGERTSAVRILEQVLDQGLERLARNALLVA
jgi:methyltransferase-like protein/2-polyprenyl-3-methyl-5-hydroxy-6-metoxy-1,4-benzoquinol methylase